MHPSPYATDSALMAATILEAWGQADPNRLNLVLDQTLVACGAPGACGACGAAEEERRELLHAIVGQMQRSYAPAQPALHACEQLQTCRSLLAHLSGAAHGLVRRA